MAREWRWSRRRVTGWRSPRRTSTPVRASGYSCSPRNIPRGSTRGGRSRGAQARRSIPSDPRMASRGPRRSSARSTRARIVSVPNLHWTNGALVDLEAVCERAHELGASLVLDVSQSAGAMPLDVGTLRPDFLVSVGYKWLLGPFSLAYLYVDERHRDGEPIEHNWIVRAGAEDF